MYRKTTNLCLQIYSDHFKENDHVQNLLKPFQFLCFRTQLTVIHSTFRRLSLRLVFFLLFYFFLVTFTRCEQSRVPFVAEKCPVYSAVILWIWIIKCFLGRRSEYIQHVFLKNITGTISF